MQDFNLQYVNCDLCGHDNTQIIIRKRGDLVNKYFNIVRCNNCGLIYVNPRLPKEALPYLYDETYFRGEGFDKSVNLIADMEDSKSKRPRELNALVKRCSEIQKGNTNGNKLLDFGCGTGQVLKSASQIGYEVLGIDISQVSCQLIRNQGFSVYCGEVTDEALSEKEGEFDIVTAIEVLEHLYEPKRCLKAIYKLLRPGGILFYTTGNAERIEVEGINWSYLHPEGHLYYFTPTVMQAYFTEIGFETMNPYECPAFYLTPISSPNHLPRNIAKWMLLHSRFLRMNILRPYLRARRANLMPIAKKPSTNI